MSEFFKNTFGKDSGERNLQYDNTAFLFFIMSVSVTLAVTLFFLILRHIKTGGKSRREYNLVEKDALFEEKRKALKNKLPSVYASFSFIIKFILFIVFVAVAIVAFDKAEGQNTTLKGFDPYQLLGVDFNTPVPQIKKAYRKLALELHPDRNPNNPEAASKFIFVSKAYECLTDETKKQKCLKYGNPDGSQSFNVGIALPSFLVEPENQIYVMFVMFAVLLLVIPKLFLMWNSKFQTKDARGIMVANYYLLYRTVIKCLSPESVMKAASQMKEVQDLTHHQIDDQIDENFVKNFELRRQQLLKDDQEANHNAQSLNKQQAGEHNHDNCQHEHGHEHNHNQEGDQQQQGHDHEGGCCDEQDYEDDQEIQPNVAQTNYDAWRKTLKPVPQTIVSAKNLLIIGGYIGRQIKYHKILEQMPNLLRSMIYFSLDFCTKSNKKKKSLFQDDPNLFFPFMGTAPYHTLLSISKNFYQNASGSDEGLENLTLSGQEIEKLTKEYNIRKLTIDEAEKTRFLQNFKEPTRKQSLKEQIELMPALKMEISTFAGDQPETSFCSRDTVTFKFKITKNPTHGVAFLPNFGYLKREKFYFTLELHEQLLYFQEVVFEPGQTEYNIEYSSYRSRDVCEQSFLALVRSDCYFGLDVGKSVPLKFVEYTGDEKIYYNKEDLHVQRIPKGYFEQALSIELTDPMENVLSDTADEENGDLEEIPLASQSQQPQQQEQKAPAMEKIQ